MTDRSLSEQPRWVDAAPFRAHVRHVLAAADLPWPVLAIESGVPVTALRALLYGRGGRALNRLEPRIASKLLQVTPAELGGFRRAQVPAGPTAARLRTLLAMGVDANRLAAWCELQPEDFRRLIAGRTPACSRLTESLTQAAQRMATTPVRQPHAA